MSHLKSLTLTVSPQHVARNPKLNRRQKMVDRLEEQLKLARDPTFAPIVRRWKKTIAGPKSLWKSTSASARGGGWTGTGRLS